MRIISQKNLRLFWEQHPDAEAPLKTWFRITAKAHWRNFVELRVTFPHADQVKVASGNTVTVFNIHGSDYRLVASVKFKLHLVYTLLVMTHEEYSRGQWKNVL